MVGVALFLGLQLLKPPQPIPEDGGGRAETSTGTPSEVPKPELPKPVPVKPDETKPEETKPDEGATEKPKSDNPKPVTPKPVQGGGGTKPPTDKPVVLPTEKPAEKPKAGTRSYRISTKPGAQKITVDGRVIAFGAVVKLSPGVHRFTAVNDAMGYRREFTYTVTLDDPNNALILDMESNRLVPRQIRDLPF